MDRSPFGCQIVWPSDPKFDVFVQRFKEAGITWARFDLMWWGLAEGEAGKFDFTQGSHPDFKGWNTDRAIAMLKENGIEPFPILCYDNEIYDTIRDVDQAAWRGKYAEYCFQAASRYKDQVDYWEIWNEPNTELFWGRTPDAEDYVALVKEAAPRVREADPGCVIVGLAMAGIDFDYMQKAFDAGLLDYVDVITVHPYRVKPPESVNEDIARIREMIAAKTSKSIPVWTGEWGYNTVWTEVTPKGQAKAVARELVNNLANGVDLSLYFSIHAFKEVGDGTDPEWGLLDYDLNPRPSFQAMKTLTERLPAPIHAVEDPFKIKAFPDAPEQRIAVFRRGTQKHSYTIAVWDALWPLNDDKYAARFATLSMDLPDTATLTRAYDSVTGEEILLTRGMSGTGRALVHEIGIADYPILIELEGF